MPYRSITVGTTAIPILEVLGNTADAYTLANNDLTNNLYICDRRNFNVTDADVIAIPALGSAPLATMHGTYAKTSSGTVQCLLIPGIGGWTAAPSQIQASLNALGLMKDTTGAAINTNVTGVAKDASVATVNTTLGAPAQDSIRTAIPTNISTTGVPLLTKSTVIFNQAVVALASAATATFGPTAINQIGYHAFFSAIENAAGTVHLTMEITLTWTDSVTGQTVAQDKYYMLPGAFGANAHKIVGDGPTKGDTITVTITNHDSQAVNYAFTLSGNSRIYSDDRWRTQTMATPQGLVIGGTNMPGLVLQDTNPSVGAGATVNRAMAMYTGPVGIFTNCTTAVTSDAIFNIFSEDPNTTNLQIPYATFQNPGTKVYARALLPNAQCYCQIVNQGTVAASLGMFIVAEEP